MSYGGYLFFQTFGIPVLKGNPNDLINSNTLFVSESFARRFLVMQIL